MQYKANEQNKISQKCNKFLTALKERDNIKTKLAYMREERGANDADQYAQVARKDCRSRIEK